MVFFPIHKDNYWSMVVIEMKAKTITIWIPLEDQEGYQ